MQLRLLDISNGRGEEVRRVDFTDIAAVMH
jgi:hypothetical protein